MKNNKSKLKMTIMVVVIILLLAIAFFLARKASAPVVSQNTEQTQIPIENKDALLGNKDDLQAFSIWPNSIVHGVVSYRGVIKGGYFFEANIQINILDMNKKVLKNSNAMATTDWMTAGPVSFEGNIDFTGLPKGNAYLEIHNDNPSDIRENDKSILIPITIE